jgi:hypothetical protein
MTRIKNRNDRYSLLYRGQALMCLLTFVLIFADACYEKTTTTTANADTIQRGSGR